MIPRTNARRFRGGASLLVLLAAAGAATAACDKAALLAPTNSRITLTASSRVVPLNGTTELQATVLENSGSPVPNGTTVRFSTNLGRVEPVESQTRNGVAVATFHAGAESGVAQVTAISGLATGTTSTGGSGTSGSATTAGNVVEITIGAAAANRVTLSANPSTVRPSGSSVEISALVSDTNGNPVRQVPVTFSTTRGTINPTIVDTDANGIARATLTASETATVTARVGSGADNRTATLEIRTTTTPSVTLSVTPASPSAGQPVGLTVTPAANTAPQVTVEWGDGNSQDIGVVAAARTVTHTYGSPGFYTINATATQDGDTFSNSIPVTVAQRPPVQLTVNPPSGPLATNFAFTITPTTGALISNIVINYGDGQQDTLGAVSSQVTRQHRYSATGTFTATVTQTETSGNVTAASVTVTVSP